MKKIKELLWNWKLRIMFFWPDTILPLVLKLRPSFLKSYYARRVIERQDSYALLILRTYGAAEVSELLRIRDALKSQVQFPAIKDGEYFNKYEIRYKKAAERTPEEDLIYKQDRKCTMYLRVLQRLAEFKYFPDFTELERIANSEYAEWHTRNFIMLLGDHGEKGFGVLKTMIEKDGYGSAVALRPIAKFGDKGYEVLASYYKRKSSDIDLARHTIYALAFCGGAAIPLLLEIKAQGDAHEKYRAIWALKSLAILRHQPTLDELRGLITNANDTEMKVVGVITMIEKSMFRPLWPFIKLTPGDGTCPGKAVALALLHYYREQGIEILREQLRAEKDPRYTKFIEILIKRAPLIEERENEYLLSP